MVNDGLGARRVATVKVSARRRERGSAVNEVRDVLLRSLEGEGLRSGDRLPPEHTLACELGFARNTVREALKLLEQEGLVEACHGLGWYISASALLGSSRPVTRFEGVTEMLRELGYERQVHVIQLTRREASAKEAAALDLDLRVEVVEVQRLYLHGRLALVISIVTFSANLVADGLNDKDAAGSIASWLAERGRAPVASAAEIRAVNLPAKLAKLPQVPQQLAWLEMTECCVDAEGRPVLVSTDYHRGDLFSFNVVRTRPAERVGTGFGKSPGRCTARHREGCKRTIRR